QGAMPLRLDAFDVIVRQRRDAILVEISLGGRELGLAPSNFLQKGRYIAAVVTGGERLEVLQCPCVEREARGLRLAGPHTGSVAHHGDRKAEAVLSSDW